MSAEFKERLSRLPYIENANNVRVLGEGGKEMRVVWRSSQAKKRRRV